MTDLALRPRSATELVDAAFQVFRRDPVQFIVATAIVYVPWLVLRLLIDPTANGRNIDLQHALPSAAVGLVVYAIAGGVVALLTRDVYFGRPPDLAGAFRHVGRRAAPVLVTSLGAFLLTVLGAVFLLVPALYPIAKFFAVRQAVLIENTGTWGAFSRSSELSVGVKGHILGTLALIVVLTFTVSGGAGLVMSLIPSRIIVIVIGTALSSVIYPFFAITETLLYYDVRIRNEGFDVEYLATVGSSAAPADVAP